MADNGIEDYIHLCRCCDVVCRNTKLLTHEKSKKLCNTHADLIKEVLENSNIPIKFTDNRFNELFYYESNDYRICRICSILIKADIKMLLLIIEKHVPIKEPAE